MIDTTLLTGAERAIFSLRSLYGKYGYLPFKMSKFEEYDLYVRNKDFLVSDNVITFNDTDGRLLALKPDVTLSIIKNSTVTPGCKQKVYYNENVYRVSPKVHRFKEIMQAGLETIGDIDDYCISEVVLLAAKSLECIKSDYILDISHVGIVSEAIEAIDISEKGRKALLKALGEKNVGEISAVCKSEGVDEDSAELLKKLATIYGSPSEVINKLKAIARGEKFDAAIAQLERITEVLDQNGCLDKARIDFSIINNMTYYSGVVFKGYINGISRDVLSGGQYDKLMRRMSRRSGAVGFAVYIDMLHSIFFDETDFDVDAVLLYDENSSPKEIDAAIRKISESGQSVVAQKTKPTKIRFKNLYKLCGTEVESLEFND